MKLASGLGIVFSLVISLVAGAILSRVASMRTSNANDLVQLACVVAILVCIMLFGVSAFLFARKS